MILYCYDFSIWIVSEVILARWFRRCVGVALKAAVRTGVILTYVFRCDAAAEFALSECQFYPSESAASDSLTKTRWSEHSQTTHKYRHHWKYYASGNSHAPDCWKTTPNKTPAHPSPCSPTISLEPQLQLLCPTEWLFLSSVASWFKINLQYCQISTVDCRRHLHSRNLEFWQ